MGVKKGGVVSHALMEVEVLCLPQDLPEFIEVDMAQVDLGQLVHLSDLIVPKGVELVDLTHGATNDRTVASIHTNRPTDTEE
jgi:large subunit ribosomal protein L25